MYKKIHVQGVVARSAEYITITIYSEDTAVFLVFRKCGSATNNFLFIFLLKTPDSVCSFIHSRNKRHLGTFSGIILYEECLITSSLDTTHYISGYLGWFYIV